ncbi:MAG: SIMPL domain-containing protein [Myxococcales bacterium]|nr:SIMPL domain-containing protein [Myxococcales bacterium]
MRRYTHSLVMAVAGLACGCGTPTTVIHTGGPERNLGLSVTGTAEIKVKPDIAKTSLGVEVRHTSVEAAERDATKRMQSVIEALKAMGVSQKDLQTSNYSINYEKDAPEQPRPLPAKEQLNAAGDSLKGHYRVNNQLNVTVRDLTKLGAILSAATRAGANNIWGISFELDDSSALEAKARKIAMDNAKRRARSLAELSGATLGPIASIRESIGDRIYPRMAMESHMLKAGAQDSVPVEQGEIIISHQVELTYLLK